MTRRIGFISILFSFFYFFSVSASVSLDYKQKIGSDTLLLFVHGFMGSSDKSFYDEEEQEFLYDRLIAATPEITNGLGAAAFDVSVVDYPAGFCDDYTLTEIVNYLKADLEYSEISQEYRKIVVVAHSFGGLVAKRLLLSMDEGFNNRIAGVVFLGVPSEGALLADLSDFVPLFPDDCRIINDLKSIEGSSILQDTREKWNRIVLSEPPGRRPSVHCAYEKRKTTLARLLPSVKIVPQERLETTSDSFVPANADHFEIAALRSDTVGFKWLLSSIRKSLLNFAFRKSEPRPGLGDFEIASGATFKLWHYGERLKEKRSVGYFGRPAQLSVLYDELSGCESYRPRNLFASGESVGQRVGRLEFRLDYKGFLDSESELLPCSKRNVSAPQGSDPFATLTFEMTVTGRVLIDKGPGEIKLRLGETGEFSVLLTRDDGTIVRSYFDSSDGVLGNINGETVFIGGRLSGEFFIRNIEPGNYLLSVETFDVAASLDSKDEVVKTSTVISVLID